MQKKSKLCAFKYICLFYKKKIPAMTVAFKYILIMKCKCCLPLVTFVKQQVSWFNMFYNLLLVSVVLFRQIYFYQKVFAVLMPCHNVLIIIYSQTPIYCNPSFSVWVPPIISSSMSRMFAGFRSCCFGNLCCRRNKVKTLKPAN